MAKVSVSMKMSVRRAIPTIAIRMPFAKTQKGATLVPVRMVTVT
jgi:hypothetical protein